MDYDIDATEERAPLAGMLDVGLMLDSTREGALVTDEHDTVLDANLAACVLSGARARSSSVAASTISASLPCSIRRRSKASQ